MASNIPPKVFYKLTKEEQWNESIRRFKYHQDLAEQWRKISIQCANVHIPDPEIDRPDLIDLKGTNA